MNIECHCWNQYDSLEDAVHESDSNWNHPKEIFKAELKSVGFRTIKKSIVKAKKPKENK